ncbi:esterase/lipase family protein [Thalassospira sp.]|uniref:esterase/lipase family protein n=1 Tax=Thalassospira sp. TaxID=1912094 RepID=UPI003AA8EBA8
MAPTNPRQCPRSCVLPIVFVPGIMGSRLKVTSSNKIVWDPPSTSPNKAERSRASDPKLDDEDIRRFGYTGGPGPHTESAARHRLARMEDIRSVKHIASTAWNWGFSNAAERRNRMIGPPGKQFSSRFLSVHFGTRDDLEDRVAEHLVDEKLNRGWGGVAWGSYGGFLRWLEYNLPGIIPLPAECSDLTTEVWAHPYNWSDGNKNAAQKLAKTVTQAKTSTRQAWANSDKKILDPIIITHSMGGLVGRSYALSFGGDANCHAIIHGAMPTYGAAAAYKRLKGGFEGVSSFILGRNAPQVTALLANMPGGLELLPNQFYGANWLKITDENGGTLKQLPSANPFDEIYRDIGNWWRLVKPELINPEGDRNAALNAYGSHLAVAQSFAGELGQSGFHSQTKMFYGDSDQHKSWHDVNWKVRDPRFTLPGNGDAPPQEVLRTGITYQDNYRGKIVFKNGARSSHVAEIQPAKAKGDGTVPASAGHINNANVESEGGYSFDHELAFNNEAARRQITRWLSEMVENMLTG